MAIPLPPGFDSGADAARTPLPAAPEARAAAPGPQGALPPGPGSGGFPGFPSLQPFTPAQPFAGDLPGPFGPAPGPSFGPAGPDPKPGRARGGAPPPELGGQSLEQNERDMYEGPLLRELGIDPAMIGRKLVAVLPFAPMDREVAQSGEMTVGFAILLLFTLVTRFSSSQVYVTAFFTLFLCGVLMMRLLLNLLLQGSLELDVYTIASAQSYGLAAVLLSTAACAAVRKLAPPESVGRTVAVLLLSCAGGVGFGHTTTKLLNEATGLNGVKLLVAIPAFLLACCYVMLLSL